MNKNLPTGALLKNGRRNGEWSSTEETATKKLCKLVSEKGVKKEQIEKLIEEGALVDGLPSTAHDIEVPLVNAVAAEQAETVKILLDLGADIKGEPRWYGCPLQTAAHRGHINLVKLLLSRGAPVEGPPGWDKEGATPLFMTVKCCADISRLHSQSRVCEVAEELLKAGANPNCIMDTHEHGSILMKSVESGNTDLDKLLLKYGADPKWVSEKNGESVMTQVLSKGTDKMYWFWKEAGAPIPQNAIQWALKPSQYGGGYQASKISMDVLRDITNSPNFEPNSENLNQFTPLIAALAPSHKFPDQLELIKLLLEKGADPNIRTANGRVALSWIEYFSPSSSHYVSNYNLVDAMKLLLSHGLKFSNEGATAANPTLIHRMMLANFTPMVQFLIEQGYDLSQPSLNSGVTPLMFVCAGECQDVKRPYTDYIKMFLATGKAGIDQQDNSGNTALHHAAEADRALHYKMLIDAGAKNDVKNKEGSTPADVAEREFSEGVLHYLKTGSLELVSPAAQGAAKDLKLVMIGSGAVGKTCALISFTTGAFPGEYIPTVFDNYTHSTVVAGQAVNVGLWDTASRSDDDRLTPLAFPGTDCFMFCFSRIAPYSFSSLREKWFPMVRHHCPNTPILLVSMKADLLDDQETLGRLKEKQLKVITQEEIQVMVSEFGAIGWGECSALTQKGLVRVYRKAIIAGLQTPKVKNGKKACALF